MAKQKVVKMDLSVRKDEAMGLLREVAGQQQLLNKSVRSLRGLLKDSTAANGFDEYSTVLSPVLTQHAKLAMNKKEEKVGSSSGIAFVEKLWAKVFKGKRMGVPHGKATLVKLSSKDHWDRVRKVSLEVSNRGFGLLPDTYYSSARADMVRSIDQILVLRKNRVAILAAMRRSPRKYAALIDAFDKFVSVLPDSFPSLEKEKCFVVELPEPAWYPADDDDFDDDSDGLGSVRSAKFAQLVLDGSSVELKLSSKRKRAEDWDDSVWAFHSERKEWDSLDSLMWMQVADAVRPKVAEFAAELEGMTGKVDGVVDALTMAFQRVCLVESI